MDLGLASILWTFEIKPLATAERKDAKTNLSDSAFEPIAFGAPKMFKTRFMPGNQKRFEILKRNWNTAQEEGYEPKGVRFDGCGVNSDA